MNDGNFDNLGLFVGLNSSPFQKYLGRYQDWMRKQITLQMFTGIYRCFIHWKKYSRQIILVSKTFPGFPALGVQNCLKLAIQL